VAPRIRFWVVKLFGPARHGKLLCEMGPVSETVVTYPGGVSPAMTPPQETSKEQA
jgi:hypothetical protein